MSKKIKLVSFVVALMLVVGLVIFGVVAAISQQKITMKGNVNFAINNKDLYVNDVRLQQGMSDTPKTVPGFVKGFINEGYTLDLSNATLDTKKTGSILLYFDIINLSVEGVTSNYIADASWTSSAVSGVSFEIRESSKYIDAATISAEDLTDATPISGTIILEINLYSVGSFDLSNITITIRDPQIIDVATFSTDDAKKTATVTGYTGNFTDMVDTDTGSYTRIILPSSISIKDGSVVEGDDYLVTTIGNSAFASCSDIEYIVLPQSITTIGNYAFQSSSFRYLNIPYGVTTIGYQAFLESNITEITIPESVTSIGSNAFSLCSSLTTIYVDSPEIAKILSDRSIGLTENATTVYVKSNIAHLVPDNFAFTLDSSGTQISGYKKYVA